MSREWSQIDFGSIWAYSMASAAHDAIRECACVQDDLEGVNAHVFKAVAVALKRDDCSEIVVEVISPSDLDNSFPCVVRWKDRHGNKFTHRFFVTV
ncbi:hypothetical protein HN358_03245 [Candidatus Uhrbacteria bacterium]|jgi:hypothetical protein|nr:hypothetical protein [Candidatus Uhrbacteria bacterium]MBT7717629.1 hypothetical protein [Candidatus Uhrbacteria bacterium]